MTPPDPNSTVRLKLPFIMPSQAQKHVTHNEALERLDTLCHPVAKDHSRSEPPAAPEPGDCHIVASGATGAWFGQDGALATWQSTEWEFLPPFAGMVAYVEDEQAFVFHDGRDWEQLPSRAPETVERLGINAPVDTLVRFSVASDSVIFSHDAVAPGSGDMRAIVNKAHPDATASVVFQENWSGRAEIGLTGNNGLEVKVSNDGDAWKTAAAFDPASGAVRATTALIVGEDVTTPSMVTLAAPAPTFTLRDTTGVGNAHLGFVNWVDGNGEEKVWCGLGSATNSTFTFLSHYSGGWLFMRMAATIRSSFARAAVSASMSTPTAMWASWRLPPPRPCM
ncbi:DUF2793 domain-containing protein [Mesorhizobium sp. KR1-2]|uniref:DUF2793 domain-containing protein n=1 Tax=Mesorhizobium sp. KR1-2 TaxID=3156609 RepID=UPI0032B5C9BD